MVAINSLALTTAAAADDDDNGNDDEVDTVVPSDMLLSPLPECSSVSNDR